MHGHDYEHEIFVIAGQGNVLAANQTTSLEPGDFVFVKPGEQHGFENTGDRPLQFICVIPLPRRA